MNPFITILTTLLLTSTSIRAQDNLGVKFFGLSIHPKGEKDNAFLMPNKLDKNGYLVMNFGAVVSYETFIYKDLVSIKPLQALYADCAVQLGGFSHIGVRAKIFKTGKHSLYGGIGPTLVYRRNWQNLDGYVNRDRFKGDAEQRWQYMFLWYGGEFEYKYTISDKMDIAASFIPGYPDLMSLAVGINLKLNR